MEDDDPFPALCGARAALLGFFSEAARFKKDVLALEPALVIWQVGTNAAWKDYFLDDVGAAILRGLDHLSGANADLVLMNLQYAPAVLDQHEAPTAATEETRRQAGALASAASISEGVDGTFTSWRTAPSRSMTHTRASLPSTRPVQQNTP
jgi:hypothetical protein